MTISGPSNAEARAWYRDNQIPVLAYSSLGRGMFAGIVKSDDIEGAKKILDPNAVKGYCYPENLNALQEQNSWQKKRTAQYRRLHLHGS